MAAETKEVQTSQAEPEEQKAAKRKLPKGRRYVGSKETFTYVLFDIAQSFNLDQNKTYYLTDVLVISYWWQAIISVVVSIWDIINDLFLASIVDRTNTRFGKFKPYLIIYALPGTIMAMIFWGMPVMFPETSGTYMPKIITYFVLQMLQNLATSLYEISKTGIIATITPDVFDRTRLINQANLFSSLVENIPNQVCTVLIDLVNHNKLKIKMTSLFVYMGVGTALCAGILALFFSFKVRERVLQSVEKPTFKGAVGSLFKSRPLMLLTISEFLGRLLSEQTSRCITSAFLTPDQQNLLSVFRVCSLHMLPTLMLTSSVKSSQREPCGLSVHTGATSSTSAFISSAA